LPGLRPVLPVLRRKYFRLILLYRPVQRPCLRADLLPALLSPSRRTGVPAAPAAGRGRDLGIRGGRRGPGRSGVPGLLMGPAPPVSLLTPFPFLIKQYSLSSADKLYIICLFLTEGHFSL